MNNDHVVEVVSAKEFLDIFESDEDFKDCGCFKGLEIMRKYVPYAGVEDIKWGSVVSIDYFTLINSGITIEDCIELKRLGWRVDRADCKMGFFVKGEKSS